MRKILILAGVHGDETSSILTAYEIKEFLERNKIKGVKIISRVNRKACSLGLKNNPEDNKNLNRIFPGKKEGSVSEKLAFDLFNLARGFNYVIDLHTYSKGRECLPFVLTDLSKNFNKDFAKSLSARYSVQTKGSKGQLFLELSNLNIPSVIIEAGSSENINRKYIQEVKKMVINFILKKGSGRTIFIQEYIKLKDNLNGKFVSLVNLGDVVKKGNILGKINGKKIKSPFNAIVLGIFNKGKHNFEQDYLYSLGKLG